MKAATLMLLAIPAAGGYRFRLERQRGAPAEMNK